MIFVVLVRSAERERLVRVFDGDADRCVERDDGRGDVCRPSFILNFTLNIFFSYCNFVNALCYENSLRVFFFLVLFALLALCCSQLN